MQVTRTRIKKSSPDEHENRLRDGLDLHQPHLGRDVGIQWAQVRLLDVHAGVEQDVRARHREIVTRVRKIQTQVTELKQNTTSVILIART